MKTINQIVAKEASVLKTIATNHRQINSYDFGDPWEAASSGTTNYPLMFSVLENTRYVKNERQFTIAILIMDTPHADERDELEIISDCELMLQDVVAQLRHSDYSFLIEDTVPVQDYTETLSDRVSGVRGDVTFRLPFEYDRCAIPTDTITITNTTDR